MSSPHYGFVLACNTCGYKVTVGGYATASARDAMETAYKALHTVKNPTHTYPTVKSFHAAELQSALLTRSEIQCLLGSKEVSKLYGRKMRCSIKKKIETLTELEIPLLLDRGFSVTAHGNGVTIGGTASGSGRTW